MSNKDINLALDLALAALSSPAAGLINPAIPAGAALLAKLVAVARASVKAHEQATGAPLDLSVLHQIEPLPAPQAGNGEDAEGEPI